MMAALSLERICALAAEYDFSAAYCCVPVPEDQAPEEIVTLVVLVRAYTPGGKLVDAFYPASNAAYHQAEALAKALDGLRLPQVRLKPICARLPVFAQGINTLDYLPGYGSRFCMELIGLTQKVPLPAAPAAAPLPMLCQSCQRCILACPTGALSAHGFARQRCLRNDMLSGKPMPSDHRALIGVPGGAMGIVGCDVCQRVCPHNAPIEKQRVDADAFTLQELLACDTQTLTRFAELYGRNYANRNRILAQAVLTAANLHDAQYLPQITALGESASATVRDHAQWAREHLSQP